MYASHDSHDCYLGNTLATMLHYSRHKQNLLTQSSCSDALLLFCSLFCCYQNSEKRAGFMTMPTRN